MSPRRDDAPHPLRSLPVLPPPQIQSNDRPTRLDSLGASMNVLHLYAPNHDALLNGRGVSDLFDSSCKQLLHRRSSGTNPISSIDAIPFPLRDRAQSRSLPAPVVSSIPSPTETIHFDHPAQDLQRTRSQPTRYLRPIQPAEQPPSPTDSLTFRRPRPPPYCIGIDNSDGKNSAEIRYLYSDGTTCPAVVDGEPVNPNFGLTKNGLVRKRLPKACTSCRAGKIKCEPTAGGCIACTKHGWECSL